MINFEVEGKSEFYIKIDLAFFNGEKTEKPTQKKKSKARGEGQVAISKEIAVAATLILGFMTLKFLGKYIYKKCYDLMNFDFSLIKDANFIINDKYLFEFCIFLFVRIIVICAPIFLVNAFIGFTTNLLQVGWHPTTKPLKPKFQAFNPVNGLKKMFSSRQIIETLMAIFKIAFISIIIITTVSKEVHQIRNIIFMDLIQAVIYIGNLCLDIGIKVGYWFIIIAILDFIYQRFSHTKKLKMSKQDMKEEFKQTEGDPIIKSKIRQKMRESSLRRMMQEIPNADVIITNPTHFAIAIKYDRQKETAPIVVAKGVDYLAQKIKNVAKENNIEIIENKPLARALYSSVEIGKEIPPELYQAVAEVLAFVYKLKNMI